MAKSIAFVHHKGGTGKTTSCINVAGHLAAVGKKVLVVDLDPQSNATSALRTNKKPSEFSMYNVLLAGTSMDKVIVQTDFDNLHLAPSAYELAWVELDGNSMNKFSQSLNEVKDYYDYILIDTPPSLGRLMVSGIVAADNIVTTLDVGIFALDGLETMEKVFDAVKKEAGREIGTNMIILTKAKGKSPVSKILKRKDPSEEIQRSLRHKFKISKKNIFLIPNDKNVYESQVQGEPLVHFSPRSKASVAYKKVAKDILKW